MIRIMKNVPAFIALACLLALLVGSALIAVSNFGLAGLAGVVVVAAIGWAVASWYFADETPLFAPKTTAGRVTFVAVIQGFFRDCSEIARPVWMRVWLNAPVAAVVVLDGVSLMQDDMRSAIMANPYMAGAIIGLNLIARYGSTPAHAPVAPRA